MTISFTRLDNLVSSMAGFYQYSLCGQVGRGRGFRERLIPTMLVFSNICLQFFGGRDIVLAFSWRDFDKKKLLHQELVIVSKHVVLFSIFTSSKPSSTQPDNYHITERRGNILTIAKINGVFADHKLDKFLSPLLRYNELNHVNAPSLKFSLDFQRTQSPLHTEQELIVETFHRGLKKWKFNNTVAEQCDLGSAGPCEAACHS